MKVLVTGATSGLGRNAAQWLLQSGYQLHACGRNAAVGQQLTAAGGTFSQIDLAQASLAECQQLMAGCDSVWHCAARSAPWGKWNAFYQDNVLATERLAEAAGCCGVPCFVHISTPAIYFDFRHHHDVDESYRAKRLANYYAQSKYQAEQIIGEKVARYPDTRYIILRPRGLFGPYDRVIFPRILAQLKQNRGRLVLPRGGEALLDLTYVGNVVYAMFLASKHEHLTSGAIYNITNQQPARLAEMLHALVVEQLGMPCQIQSLPYSLLHMMARGMELVALLAGKEPLLTRYSVGVANFDMTLSSSRAIDELGYQPAFSLQQGIMLTANWLAQQGRKSDG